MGLAETGEEAEAEEAVAHGVQADLPVAAEAMVFMVPPQAMTLIQVSPLIHSRVGDRLVPVRHLAVPHKRGVVLI